MLRVMTYNICLGGVDDDTTNRLPLIHEVVREGCPDVLAVQEANEFDLRQYRRLFAFERATGLRGLLHPVHNGALFVRPDLQPIALWTGDPVGNLRMALRLRGPGGRELTVCSVHLDPISPELRLAGALRATSAPPAIALGDFNNFRADDPDMAKVCAEFSPRHQARAFTAGATHVDDRVFVALERAGYVDLFRLLRPREHGHTVPGVGRLDYIFATQDLAERATRCDVLQTPETDRASDHYPVLADFELEL